MIDLYCNIFCENGWLIKRKLKPDTFLISGVFLVPAYKSNYNSLYSYLNLIKPVYLMKNTTNIYI